MPGRPQDEEQKGLGLHPDTQPGAAAQAQLTPRSRCWAQPTGLPGTPRDRTSTGREPQDASSTRSAAAHTSGVGIDDSPALRLAQDEHGFRVAELQAVPLLHRVVAGADCELDLLRDAGQKAI